jgi:lysophospholipid acyltransferase
MVMAQLLAAIDQAGIATGLGAQQFRFVVCLLSCYPFGLIHRKLPSTKGNHIKYLYSLVIGMAQAYLCFESDIIHFIGSTLATYLIMALFPKRCGWIAFIYNMAHITWGNYDRMVNDYLGYSLNWTVPQMILLCKLTSIAWNYEDGQVPDAVMEKRDRDGFQRSHALKTLPSILEVFSYAFFFAGFLSGPWSDFAEYRAFVDMSMFKEEEGGAIPFPGRFLAMKFLAVALALVGYVGGSSFDINWLTTAEFASYSWPARVGWYILHTELFYFKYYVVWWLGEGATALIGLAYNGRNAKGEVKWDRVRMLDLVRYKFAKSIVRDCVPSWNMMSQHWLRRYVHQRFMALGFPHTASRVTTFVTSALWHGLYPGYFVFFGMGAIFGGATHFMYHTMIPYFYDENGHGIYPRKYLFDFGSTAIIWIFIDYMAPTFQLLAFSYGIFALNQIYWFCHIAYALSILLWAIHKVLWPNHLKIAKERAAKIDALEKQAAAIAAAAETPKKKQE